MRARHRFNFISLTPGMEVEPAANAAEEAKTEALNEYKRVLLQHKEADARVRFWLPFSRA